jgi:hypothetical protein
MTEDRRADKRFLLHSPVEITGVDESGIQFVEQSRLEDAGDLGCRFSLRNAVRQGSILGVEPLGPEGEDLEDEYSRLFVIIWMEPNGDRLTIGARCLLEDELTESGYHTNGFNSKVPAK